MSALRTYASTGTLNRIDPVEQPDADVPWPTFRWTVGTFSARLALTVCVDLVDDAVVASARAAAITQVAAGFLPIVIARFISPASRRSFEEAHLSYWDATGNAYIHQEMPYVWVRESGSTKDPDPGEAKASALLSLKGRSASDALVWLLMNNRAASVRDLAREAKVGLGTASRVVSLLRNENLLEPTAGGPIIPVDREAIALRWADDYNFVRTNKARRYFSVLGPDLALGRIQESQIEYGLSGLAAQAAFYRNRELVAPLPATDLWIYTTRLPELLRIADLVPSATGSIYVAEGAFLVKNERYVPIGDSRIVQPWRVAGDLMSMSGRFAAAGRDFAALLSEIAWP